MSGAMKDQKIMARQDLPVLKDEPKLVRREMNRSKTSLWHKVKNGLKRFWSKLLRRKIKTKKTMENENKSLLSTPPPHHPSILVTPAIDTPTKKIIRPTPSFVDNLEHGSVLTLLTETLTESPLNLDGSYLERFRSPQRKVTVAPSSSWVQCVLGSSISSSDLVTSTLEIQELAFDDVDTSPSLTRGESTEDLYLYCYRS